MSEATLDDSKRKVHKGGFGAFTKRTIDYIIKRKLRDKGGQGWLVDQAVDIAGDKAHPRRLDAISLLVAYIHGKPTQITQSTIKTKTTVTQNINLNGLPLEDRLQLTKLLNKAKQVKPEEKPKAEA